MLGKWVVRIYEPNGRNDIYSDYFPSRYSARAWARGVKAGLREVDKVEIFQDKEGFLDIFGDNYQHPGD